MRSAVPGRRVWAWALLDWANSAFATTVMAGFFPHFFAAWWQPVGIPATVVTWRLGCANAAASIVMAALAPVLGAIADHSRGRRRFLILFTMLGVMMTGGLWFVAQGQWLAAAVLYALANLGFAGNNLFCDSFLVDVAPEPDRHRASVLGYALGYLGGGLLFALNVLMFQRPAWFGLPDPATAVRVAFVMVAVWWAVFTIPFVLFVKESGDSRPVFAWAAVRAGCRQLVHTLGEARRLRQVWLFLVAYWLYIDGVDTVIKMAVSYGGSQHLAASALIGALLVTQFVGFPAAVAFGYLGDRWGAKRAILGGLVVYLGITVWGYFLAHAWEFYVLAVLVGLVQGGVQALSRSLYSRLIPAARAGEFFGLYNMLGKTATIIGPPLMGAVGLLTGNTRASILSLAVLFLVGGALLWYVKEPTSEPV